MRGRLAWGSSAAAMVLAGVLAASMLAGCGRSSDAEDVAATVDGVVIAQGEVAAYVMAYRDQLSLEDDAAWQGWLEEAGATEESVRSEAIESLIEDVCVLNYARENGYEASDEEIDQAISSGNVGNELWRRRAESLGYADEEYREAVRALLSCQNVARRAVAFEEPSDEELLEIAVARSASLGKR